MDWMQFVSWAVPLVSLVIVIVTFIKTGRKERKAEYVEEDAKIDEIKTALLKANMKLDTVCATTNETRTDIKAMNEYIHGVEKRVSVIENDLKTVWIRIDELKEQVNHHD